MVNLFGKFFYSSSNGKIVFFPYELQTGYYELIKKASDDGFRQCIITSDIMIRVIEHLLFDNNGELNSIQFMIDDEELQAEVGALIKRMKNNSALWSKLRDKIEFLDNSESIEIKSIELRCKTVDSFLIKLLANGVICVSENQYSMATQQIAGILEGCIR